MPPFVADAAEATGLLLFDEEEVTLDNVLLSCLANDFDDEDLLQAYIDEHLEFDLPPIPEEEVDDEDVRDADQQEEKFDRAATITNNRLSRRKKLFAYFRYKVIETKRWKKNVRFPKKGKDSDLDTFMQAIGCPKRKNASDAWRIFRKSLGVVLPSNFFSDLEKLLDEYNMQTHDRDGLIDGAISDTRSCTEWIGYTEEQYDRLAACSRSTPFVDAAQKTIGELNKQLASSLCGVSATNLNERANRFTHCKNRVLQFLLRDQFRQCWQAFDDKRGVVLSDREVNRWGVRVFQYLVKRWTEAIWSHGCAELVTELEEGEAESLLGGSLPTLYVIAGWVLFRMRKRLTARKYFEVVREFVQNAVASNEDTLQLKPVTGKLERTEVHKNKMCRAGSLWFQFIQALDALYCANLTASNALQYGATLLKEIDAAIASSTWLEEHFARCIPDSISENGRAYLLKIYRSSILPSYSRMRGRDVVRRIKARKSSLDTLSSGLPTRSKVKAASIAAFSR